MVEEVKGPRREEFEAQQRRLGITRQELWLQRTPQGDIVIVFLEGDDPAQMMPKMAASNHPTDIEFRRFILDVHGIDVAQPTPGPLSELMVEFRGEVDKQFGFLLPRSSVEFTNSGR